MQSIKKLEFGLVGALAVTGVACAGGPVPELVAPGVRIGADRVTTEVFFEDPEVGPRKLSWAACGEGGERLLVVGGDGAAALVTPGGELVRRVETETVISGPPRRLEVGLGDLVPVQADGDPACELMDPGGGWQPVGLFDDDGSRLWHFPPSRRGASPDQMAAGNLDGDGNPDFVVGMNGFGGIRVLDVTGKEVRKLPGGNVFSVALFDADGDGLDEIVHTEGRGVVGRAADGTLLGWATRDFPSFVVVPRMDGSKTPGLAGWAEGEIRVVDLNGKVLDRVPAPVPGHTPSNVVYLPPRHPGGPPLLAVARTLTCRGSRSQLLVAEDGRLVYEENLETGVIAATVADDGGEPSLLIADGNRILRYRFR